MGVATIVPGFTITQNRIVLAGQGKFGGGRYEEAIVTGTPSPGHLLELLSDGTVQKHSNYGGEAEGMIAVEDSLQGKTINDAYVAAALGRMFIVDPGTVYQARIPANAPAIVIGDKLISNGDGTLIKGPAGGGRQLFANTVASTAVANTVTETLFDQNFAIPANTLKVGDVIKIRAQAIAPLTNATDTLTLKLYIGGLAGTLVISSGAVDVANNDEGYFDVEIIVRTIGAGGTFVATGTVGLGTPGTVTAKPFLLGSTALNTTVAQVLGISATWSVANAGDSARLDVLDISIDRATGARQYLAIAAQAVDNSAGGAETFCNARWL